MDFHESIKVDSEKDYSGIDIIFFDSFSYVFATFNYLLDLADLHNAVCKIKQPVHL